jgi:hypothetical protein
LEELAMPTECVGDDVARPAVIDRVVAVPEIDLSAARDVDVQRVVAR